MIIVSFKSRPTWERSYKIINTLNIQSLVCKVFTNLDVVALVVVATFPKQAMMHDIVNVQLVEQRVSILGHRRQNQTPDMISRKTYFGDRSCKYHNLIELANALHELIDAWSFDDIYIMILALNLHRYRKIGLI